MTMGEDRWTSSDFPESPRAAVSVLFHLHYRRLVGLASVIVDDRETAEEVVQDAFESLYRSWGRLRDPSVALTYLNRSVVNGSRSTLRRRKTVRAYDLPPEALAPSAEAAGVDGSQRGVLLEALKALPRRQREVLVLRYYLDLSEEQIADWLGVSKGSVKQHASRATAALQKRMEAWA